MPVVPPFPTGLPSQVFWSAEDVLNFARMLINDMQGGVAGQELADSQPYTWWLLNLAYAKLQNALEDTNVESVTYSEAIVGPLTAAPSAGTDPNTQVRLGYDGYYDGTNETDENIILPGDLLEPTLIWERPSGSSQPFVPMKQQLGGLQPRWGGWGVMYSYARLGSWEMRSDGFGNPAIFMPGCQIAIDLRIRYIPSLALLVMGENEDGTPAYPQIPLARAGEALAYGVAYQWASIRGAANAASLKSEYDSQIQILANKSAKRENATVVRARGYGFGRSRRRWW